MSPILTAMAVLTTVLYNSNTHQTAIWYLNDNQLIDAAFGPTLPAGWSLAAAADFNGDGYTDYALFNSATGQTVIAYLSGLTVVGRRLRSVTALWLGTRGDSGL